MEVLSDFQPVVTGTIPINIDTEQSDVDLCCYWQNENTFQEVLNEFSGFEKFQVNKKVIKGRDSIIADFEVKGFSFEIFGQNRPTHEQEAYLHMIKEHEILQRKGNDFRQRITLLKKGGMKTEPAFAHLLGLKGDPYDAILAYSL